MIVNISAALYLFANGILALIRKGGISGLFDKGGEFGTMLSTLGVKGDLFNVLIIVLGVCGIAAGVFILMSVFKIEVPITDLILLIFIVLWILFIIVVDIVNALDKKPDFLPYLLQLSPHLMVLGVLAMSTKRFGGN
jgi:hypothetical protein